MFKKWDSGFITVGQGIFAHGSTREKTIRRALGQGSLSEADKVMATAGCLCRAVARDGKMHVMSVSFPLTPGVPDQFFAFANPIARDNFMRALETRPLDSVRENEHELGFWLKGCLVLEACTKGIKSFVSSVMKQVHCRVLDQVKEGIARDIGVCENDDFLLNWDCSTCSEADKKGFTDDAPVFLYFRAMDANGVVHCENLHKKEIAHYLLPQKLHFCYLKNIPAGLFLDSDVISPNSPLFLCRNPNDNPDSKEFKSSSFILLRGMDFHSNEPHLIPFSVRICRTSGDGPIFRAVLCSSRRGHTKVLVESYRSNTPLPKSKSEDSLSFGFWTVNDEGPNIQEVNHRVKPGDVLCFYGPNLPHGILPEQRYLAIETSTSSIWSFNVKGPIVCPASALAADAFTPDQASLVAVRRSPIGRYVYGMLAHVHVRMLFVQFIDSNFTTRNFHSASLGFETLLFRYISEHPKWLINIGLASKPSCFLPVTENSASFSAAKPTAKSMFSMRVVHAAVSSCST